MQTSNIKAHTLIVRYQANGRALQFAIQRQQAGTCSLTAPEDIIVEGRPDSNLRQDLRWYLEHFLDYPLDPNTGIADRVRGLLGLFAFLCSA